MDQKPGFIMCVCTGKCPGFSQMDLWDFINQVRVELPVEYGFIHPQLCEEDGDRFLADYLKANRPVVIGACSPNMQFKMFKQAFADSGLDVKKDLNNLNSFGNPLGLNIDSFNHLTEVMDLRFDFLHFPDDVA